MKYISLIVCFCFIITPDTSAQKQKVWLDADTGNEMDDLYAIVRLVKDSSIEVAGLSSAHFNNPDLLVFEKWNGYDTKGLNTVVESQRLNEELLDALGRMDIPHPIGADRQMGRGWGQEDPRDSPAAQEMIRLARSTPSGQPLYIVTLGALTNLASAIKLAPDILPKIKVFALGIRYNVKTGTWSKNEFNIRNDLNATDYLLNVEGLDFTIMPIETALPLKFNREDTYARLDENNKIERILENRWREQNPQDITRIMWDLALVEAFLHPEYAKTISVKTPPENHQHKIKAIVNLQAPEAAADFWKVLKQ